MWSFGIHIFPVLVYCTTKNLATLDPTNDPQVSVHGPDFGHPEQGVEAAARDVQDDRRCQEHAEGHQPGIDFMKLDFGRKVFRQIFTI
jgi:hypothetical protein